MSNRQIPPSFRGGGGERPYSDEAALLFMNIMIVAADTKIRDVRAALELTTKALDALGLASEERMSDGRGT
jgi:hypothetical protein